MSDRDKRIRVVFYRSAAGVEPVREWLKSLTVEDRKIIGIDIKTVEFGWPVGMPICRSLGNGLWEVRSSLTDRKIGRVIFSIRDGDMYLLHGFIKKSQKTPKADLDAAMSRRKDLES